MESIEKIEFNKTYVINDIFSTSLTNVSNFEKLIDVSNSNIVQKELKTNIFFASILKIDKKTDINIFPLECVKICELILYLKIIYKERTADNIFPFCFYIRKKNDITFFIALDKRVRQLLFGLYEHIYEKVYLKKGILYGLQCNFNSINIYKTNIPSENILKILENTDKLLNRSLIYNCMICKKVMVKIQECEKCKWAIYCSDKCFNNKKFKQHITDDLLEKRMDYLDELKLLN